MFLLLKLCYYFMNVISYLVSNSVVVVAAPSPPVALDVTTTSSSELTIKWQPPQEPNGNVTHYVVTGSLIKDDETILDQRNYCNERKCSWLFSCYITDMNLGYILCVAKNWVYSLVSTSFRPWMHIYDKKYLVIF